MAEKDSMMPITVEKDEEECVVIINVAGNVKVEEIEDINSNVLAPFMIAHSPKYVDVIWNALEFEADFGTFIKLLSARKKHRNNSTTPTNFNQYFVGNNTWVRNFRSWLQKNFQEDTGCFTNMDDALFYIRKKD